MARDTADPVLEECGLTFQDVAVSAARVFAGAVGMNPDEIDGDHEGWGSVATLAAAQFQSGEDNETTITFSQFARLLHKAFARAGDPDAELPGFDQLQKPVQVAWLAVSRHMANVFNMEAAEARRLSTHEGQMVDWAKKQLATP